MDAAGPRTSPSPLDLESEGPAFGSGCFHRIPAAGDAQELRIFSQPGRGLKKADGKGCNMLLWRTADGQNKAPLEAP